MPGVHLFSTAAENYRDCKYTELYMSGIHKLNICKSYYILNALEELTIEKNSVVKFLCRVKSAFVIIIL